MNHVLAGFRGGWLLFAAAVVLIASGPLSAQSEGSDCSSLVSDRTYAQGYGGFVNVPVFLSAHSYPSIANAGLAPATVYARLKFLPGGQISGTATLSLGALGVIQDLTLDNYAVYSLTWDGTDTPNACSGTMTVSAPKLPTFHFNLIVAAMGREVDFSSAETGVGGGVPFYELQPGLTCSDSFIDGVYTYNMPGWALAATGSGIPSAQLLTGYSAQSSDGLVEFQPSTKTGVTSTFTYWGWTNNNGTLSSWAGSGTYKVKEDCSGTMTMNVTGGGSVELEFFAGDPNGAVYLTVVSPTSTKGPVGYIPGSVAAGAIHPDKMLIPRPSMRPTTE